MLALLPSAGAATLYVGAGQSYTTIGAALNDAVDGDTIFVYNGTYVENLVISKNVSIVGEDASTTIVLSSSSSSFAVVLDRTGIRLDNLTITGATSSQYAGVRVNVNNTTISGCNVSSNYDGIYIVGADYTSIVDCTLENNTRWSMRIQYDSRYNTISNNTISGGDNGIYIKESNANTDTQNTISNNTIFGCVGSGVYLGNAQHNTISNNDISGCRYGIYLNNAPNNTISNNTIHDILRVNNFGGYALLGVGSSHHNVIADNRFSSCFRGVFLSGVDDTNIGHNRLSNFTESGLYLVYCNNSAVHGNVVNTTYYGIYLFGSPHATITSNTAHDAGRYGIIVYGYSDYSSIEGNEVYGCYQGIFLHDINFTRIRNNYAHDNNMSGVYAGNTTWCTFEQNRLERNEWGIWTRLSRHNQIRQNVAHGNLNYSYQVSFDRHSVFEDNVGTDTSRYGGVFLPWCNNTTVRNNTLENGIYGIVLYNATRNRVEHNVVSGYRYGVIITNTTFYSNAYIPYITCGPHMELFKKGAEFGWDEVLPEVGGLGAEHSASKKKPNLPLTFTFTKQIHALRALSRLAPVTSNVTQPIEPEGIFLPADYNSMENNTILVDGRSAFGVIITSMGNLVRNNTIMGSADTSFGILVQGAPESSASHNVLTGNHVHGFTNGIMVAGIGPKVLSFTQISNNTVERCGIGIEVLRLVGNVDVVANTLSSSSMQNSYGVVVMGDVFTPTNISVSSNELDDFKVAVLVLCRAEDAALRNNDLGGNSFGVFALSWDRVDARLNWWGSPRGPRAPHAAKAIGNVIYVPWLTSPP